MCVTEGILTPAQSQGSQSLNFGEKSPKLTMIPSSYFALAMTLIPVIRSASAGEMPPYWSIRQEYTVGAVLKIMATRNMYQCERLCWVTPECASASFSTDTRLCSLIRDVPGSSDVTSSRTDITSSATKTAETEWTSKCHIFSCQNGALCVSSAGNYMCLQHEINCPTPPNINHANVSYSNTTYNSTASYSCHVGFSFQGSSEVNRCDESGQWSGLSGECAVVSCGSPAPLSDSDVTYTTVTYLSTAQYSCHVGYNFLGSSKDAECAVDGSWVGFSGTCQIVSCSTPSPLDYATESYTTLTYGSTVTYTCNSGFNFLGSSDTATCEANGAWEGLLGVCVGYCAPPVDIANADVTYTLIVDGIANYTCNIGFIFTGTSNVATCGSNLQWSGFSGSCQGIVCNAPVPVPFATKASTGLTYGSTTTYTCDAGYEFLGSSNTSTCDDTANWSGFQGSCVYIPVCSTPVNLLNAEVTYSSLREGSMATYTCDIGYNFVGSSNIATCGNTLSWSGLVGTCTIVNCLSAPTLLNSNWLSGASTYGSAITFTCKPGFEFTGSSNVATCDENGVWAGLSGSCDTVPLCPDPPPLTNANVTWALKTVGSGATYTCDVGYNFQGSSQEARCETTLQWNGLNGDCEIVTCSQPSSQPKSQPTQTGLTYGSTVTYTCNTGYQFTGRSNVATCDATGSWSGFSGSCTIVSCLRTLGVANADVDATTVTFGSTVTYTCLIGHRFSDDTDTATVTCQANGLWSSNPGACTIIERPLSIPEVVDIQKVFSLAANKGDISSYNFLPLGRSAGTPGFWRNGTEANSGISCGVPPDLDNAVVTYSSVTYGSVVEYPCRNGYEFSGSSDSARCNEDGNWEGFSGKCEIVTCPNPPDDPNGKVDYPSKDFRSYATYTCDDGFIFRGIGVSTSTRCRANGQWSSLSASCEYIRDCKDLYDADDSLGDGEYVINPGDWGRFDVWCDMSHGGWTVFQRREDGSEDFSRKWDNYRSGFGHLDGEFWLGNKYINRITIQRTYTLRVDMKGYSNWYYADYSHFRVQEESQRFKLEVSGYSGNAGDSFAFYHNDMYFSTDDKENDRSYLVHCSQRYHDGLVV